MKWSTFTMLWEQELNALLHQLGVQHEENQSISATPSPETTESSFFLTKSSRTHQGVSYRCDLLAASVELRVYVPCDESIYKMQCYLVTFSPHSFHSGMLTALLSYEGGSTAYKEIEGTVLYRQMVFAMELLEDLFWQGDLVTQQFPSEIVVARLL